VVGAEVGPRVDRGVGEVAVQPDPVDHVGHRLVLVESVGGGPGTAGMEPCPDDLVLEQVVAGAVGERPQVRAHVAGTGERSADLARLQHHHVVTGLGGPASEPRPRGARPDHDEVAHAFGWRRPGQKRFASPVGRWPAGTV
jgi:hypothetical protein